MDDSGREMNCVARRTRRKWDDYFEKRHGELKRKRLIKDGLGGSDQGVMNDSEFNGGGGGIMEIDENEFNGGGVMEIDEDEFNNVVVSKIGDDDGVEMLKIYEDECSGVGILENDERVDDEGVEIPRSQDDDAGFSVEILKSDKGEDKDIVMLKSFGGEEEEEILKSGEDENKAQTEKEHFNGSICVSSEAEESVDMQLSESEETSNDEDEEESSTSESSDQTYQDSDDELVNTDDEAEEKLHLRQENDLKPKKDATCFVLDEEAKSLGNFSSTNLRKESDCKPQKDDKSKQNPDGGVIFNDKEKSSRIRRSRRLNPNNETDEKINEKKQELYTMDEEQKSLNDMRSFFSTNSRKESDCKPQKDGKSEEEEKIRNRFCSSFVPNESPSTIDDVSSFFSTPVVKTKVENMMFGIKKSRSARDLDMIKILVDSINSVKQKQYTIDEKALAENSLPLKFKFEEEVVPPPEKSEWEKHIDSLFFDLELGLQESETNCSDIPKMEKKDLETTTEKVDDSPPASCRRGDHQAILDEQIGIFCEFCGEVIMDIKHMLPPFHAPPCYKRDRKALYYDEPPSLLFSDIHFDASPSTNSDPTSYTYGTVWDLIPGVKNQLYPHQQEGFEFMWKNLAGGIIIEKLSKTLPDEARGCIISHAPGTGKTRLTIVFLQTFLKMYPSCSPMIIAPRGMLLTWESEFKKWNFNVSFHNLNKKELSGKENAVAAEILGQVGSGILSVDCVRLLKLYSWATGGSVLGLSYPLFEKLAGENGRRIQHEKIREVLLQRPGLLILDEGHTPRNENSQIWKVLKNVSTQRRIILSGTPFQNSLQELCNTLCVANPKFVNQIGYRRYGRLTSSFDTNRDEAMKLKAILAPFIHVHKGTVLKESLPGIRHTLVFLHPTQLQKTLLKTAWKVDNFLRRNRMISLISVHPSILKEDDIKAEINEGVKTRFLMKLIQLSNALGERVLVFSQFIDSLVFIKNQLQENMSWHAGKEVLYMDGQVDDKRRQESISSFNDERSEAKVLLASVKACSEGINLIGASRVVLLDTLWNPSVEKQAICRAYRLGQKKVVHVYRLFTTGVEVRLGQFPCQLHKEQVSRWLFSLGEEPGDGEVLHDDKVMEAMLHLESFKNVFDKVLAHPKEADIIKTFGL